MTEFVPGMAGALPRDRSPVLSAAMVAGGALLALVTLAVDAQTSFSDDVASAWLEPGWWSTAVGLAQVLPGAVLLRAQPRHAVGWVLVGSGFLWQLDGLATSWARYAVYVEPGAAGASVAFWIYSRLGAAILVGLPLLLLLFPDGRLPRRPLLRRLSLGSVAVTALLPLVLIVVPSEHLERFHGRRLPPELAALALDPMSLWAVPYSVWAALLGFALPAVGFSLLVPALVLTLRYRASRGIRRRQLRWLMWAAVVSATAFVVGTSLPAGARSVVVALGVATTSTAVVLAVTRYRLYDVDRLLLATVRYVVLAGAVVLVDIAVFATAGTLVGERGAALAAVALVAALYVPVRTHLWHRLLRLVRNQSDPPDMLVASLARRLEHASAPVEQLREVAASIAHAFRLPYVRVELSADGGGSSYVEHGRPQRPQLSLPLVYRGQPVGSLVLCTQGGKRLDGRQQRVLADLVRQAAGAAWASELAASLQGARRDLVAAREEERRRLRRDLHDTVGPGLAAVTLQVETARNLAAHDPPGADALLRRAIEQVSLTLGEVRRIAHGLRPPALDELGLAGALRELAGRFEGPVHIEVVGSVPALPAAVEVAAYRIVAEALTNVARHADADSCRVSISTSSSPVGPRCEVSIRDDGRGIPADAVAGVGMQSLRERAAELGGTLDVTCPAEGGTLVVARFPLGERDER